MDVNLQLRDPRVTVHLIEIGFTSYFLVHDRVQVKLDQHDQLRRNLMAYGWVNVQVHPVIIGHTGVMRSATASVLTAVGVHPCVIGPFLSELAITSMLKSCAILLCFPSASTAISQGSPDSPSVPDAPSPNQPSAQRTLPSTIALLPDANPHSALPSLASNSYDGVQHKPALPQSALSSTHEPKPPPRMLGPTANRRRLPVAVMAAWPQDSFFFFFFFFYTLSSLRLCILVVCTCRELHGASHREDDTHLCCTSVDKGPPARMSGLGFSAEARKPPMLVWHPLLEGTP